MAWFSDTQYYSEQYHKHFENIVDWIVASKDELNIQYVPHTGDIVDEWDEEDQFATASGYLQRLDAAAVPYGVIAGNHDVAHGAEKYDLYWKYFGAGRYQGNSYYGGSYRNNLGHYDLVTVDGVEMIFVYMSWDIYYPETEWINGVLAQYPDRKAIIAVHCGINASAAQSYQSKLLLDEVCARNKNVLAMISGHYHGSALNFAGFDDDGDGAADRVVYQICTDYQSAAEGGTGYIKMLYFDLANGKIYVNSYSPSLDDYNYYDTPKLASYPIGLNAYGIDIAMLDVDFGRETARTLTTGGAAAAVFTRDALGAAPASAHGATVVELDAAAVAGAGFAYAATAGADGEITAYSKAAALAALEPEPGAADKSALEAALAAAGEVDASLYTPESLLALAEAAAAGRIVLADGGATQGEADAAAGAIDAAIAALEEKAGPAEADKAGLASTAENAGKINTALFTAESAAALKAAEGAARAALADAGASQAGVGAAQRALEAAIAGLAVAPEHAALGELAGALVAAARLDGSLYTDASWGALQSVVDEAWAYIAEYLELTAALGAGYAPAPAEAEAGEPGATVDEPRTTVDELAVADGPEAAVDELATADELAVADELATADELTAVDELSAADGLAVEALEAALAPMATDVDPKVAELILKLQQRLAELALKPSVAPEPGVGVEAGAYSAKGVLDLVAEELAGNPEAEFLVRAKGFSGVGTANVRLTFKEADVAVDGDTGEPKVRFELPDALKGFATMIVTDRGNEFAEGYRTYSIVIAAYPSAGSGALALADGADLLVATLEASSKDAKALSLVLNYMDVLYYEGASEAFATSAIAPAVATTAIRVASRVDINRDGAVTLVDVDAVRRRLGMTRPAEGWASAADARSDLKPDGIIDIEDLTLAIRKYESLTA
ncbi:MAG: metallophosphoesterase [Clostridiales bacterium]|nr:metallophosphoesterase [Clostridiales bacterium]